MQVFKLHKTVIAMVHVQALPGTPNNNKAISDIIREAKDEALLYQNAGVDAILIENMHDVPYLNSRVGPEIVASMTAIAQTVKLQVNLPVGIQILAAANKEALAVAQAANLDFIRAEGFVFGHLADEGYIDSCAGDLLRYRKQIGAENIKIFTDIKKKHSSHAISNDVDIVKTAKAAEFFLSDGLIITGNSTGEQSNPDEVIQVKENTHLPVIIGSGITINIIESYFHLADAFIVGSAFKENSYWKNKIDSAYVHQFMKKVKQLRNE